MITLKIDVKKIDKSLLFQGKTALYLDAVMFKNDEPDQYGNDYVIKQSLSKEDRAAGKKANIIGNGRDLETGKRTAPYRKRETRNEALDEDVPF